MGGNDQAVDVAGYLEIIDLINTKLTLFKEKYANLKEKAIAEYKAQLEQDAKPIKKGKKKAKQESSSSSSSSSSSDDDDEEKKSEESDNSSNMRHKKAKEQMKSIGVAEKDP